MKFTIDTTEKSICFEGEMTIKEMHLILEQFNIDDSWTIKKVVEKESIFRHFDYTPYNPPAPPYPVNPYITFTS